jgi:Alkylmercury lyase
VDDVEGLRLAVYRSFADTGRAPEIDELATRLSSTSDDVIDGLAQLHQQRHVVLDPSGTRVVMAHPFASVPLGFSVMGSRTLWWGGCAWDSFALPHLLPDEPEVLVATRCPACGTAHAWVVGREAPPAGSQVAHFLVPAAHIWDDVVHTCGNQRLFCSPACVSAWLDATGHERGYEMDLATLWRLASRWYEGRLDRGYTRREPSEAKSYFAEVGLRGPFWGL